MLKIQSSKLFNFKFYSLRNKVKFISFQVNFNISGNINEKFRPLKIS